MASESLFNEKGTVASGLEVSLFNTLNWKEDEDNVKVPSSFIPTTRISIFDFEPFYGTNTFKSGTQFFNNLNTTTGKLSELYKSSANVLPTGDHWEGLVDMFGSSSGFLNITDLVFKEYMVQGNMYHSHTVLQSLTFRDIAITLRFQKNDQSYYYRDLILPAPKNYKSYLGIDGKAGADEKVKYQMGISQSFFYYFKIGNVYHGVKMDLSLVLALPNNEFEALGVIDAAKFYPQIEFTSGTVNIDDIALVPSTSIIITPEASPEYINLGAINVPSDVILSTGIIFKFKSRVKMVANNDNAGHVDLQTVDGVTYDFNHFKRVRENGLASKIPPMFEKIFEQPYPLNIPGFFTDSNKSGEDDRMYPGYHITGPVLPPTWSYIFDYVKPNLQYETEINAVYRDLGIGVPGDSLGKGEIRERHYKYPLTNPDNHQIHLQKKERQGEYDNIHFHGYLGNYKDNNVIVTHAPICAFCCFHMHWRWSKLNYKLNHSRFAQLFSASGEPERFDGWSNDGIKKNSTHGAPLISPYQALKIAITKPATEPYDIDHVLNPSLPVQQTLDLAAPKAVWYCSDIYKNVASGGSYVVLEQGAGYAFRYSKEGADSLNTILRLMDIALGTQILNPIKIALDEIKQYLDIPDYFEISYRLLHFFNFGDFEEFNQVPDGEYTPPNIISMKDL